jgi:hypothetical protein
MLEDRQVLLQEMTNLHGTEGVMCAFQIVQHVAYCHCQVVLLLLCSTECLCRFISSTGQFIAADAAVVGGCLLQLHLAERLAGRLARSPADFDAAMASLRAAYGAAPYQPGYGPLEELERGVVYLDHIDDKFRRFYSRT